MASETEAIACVANIDPKGRRQRLIVGLVGAGVSLGVTVLMFLSTEWHLIAVVSLVPWWVSALGIFQAREQTCVALAARGQRDLGQGPEAIPSAELEQVGRQARRVHQRAAAFTLLVVGAAVLLRATLAAS